MSNFNCEHCGTTCFDSDRGYVTGCSHYPPDIKPMRGFEMMMDYLIRDPENVKWLLTELAATDDIDSENLELRFEDEGGRDTGCYVRIQDVAKIALRRIEILEAELSPA